MYSNTEANTPKLSTMTLNKPFALNYLYLGIILACISLIWIIPNFVFKDEVPIGFSCYYEKAVLLEQYIDWTNSKHGGNCSNGCLFMKVYTENIEFLPCGHIDKLIWRNRTYFFAKEGLRENLRSGDNISVKWCYINKEIGRRIREISKIESSYTKGER